MLEAIIYDAGKSPRNAGFLSEKTFEILADSRLLQIFLQLRISHFLESLNRQGFKNAAF